MKINRVIAAALAATVIFPLSGCSISNLLWNEEYEYEYVEPVPTSGEKNYLGTDADAKDVYSEVEYIPEMFYGTYVVDGVSDSDPKTLLEPMEFIKGKDKKYSPNNDGQQLTCLPYRLEIGPHSNPTDLNHIKGNWLTMYVVSKEGEMRPVEASFTIENKSINIRQVASKNIDPENNTYDYILASNPIRLSFEFKGTDLILTHNIGESVTLHTEGVSKDSATGNMTGISLSDSNLKPGSPDILGVSSLSINGDTGAMIENDETYSASTKFGEDGFCEFEWNKKKCRLLYFYGGADGIVFSDGKNNYNYTARSYELYANSITGNISNSEELGDLSQEEINKIITLSDELNAELSQAFADAQVGVSFNQETGEITLNSVTSFDFAHSELNAAGRDLLNRFLAVFVPIICSDKYSPIITGISIEGHTDTKGSDGYNQVLSKNRADSVLNYTLSPDSGISQEYIDKLTPLLSSVGFASRFPIYNEDGSVNEDASRRVVFHFSIGSTAAAE